MDCIVRRFTESHFLVLENRRSRARARRALLVPAESLPRAVTVISEGLDWRSDDIEGIRAIDAGPEAIGLGTRAALRVAGARAAAILGGQERAQAQHGD